MEGFERPSTGGSMEKRRARLGFCLAAFAGVLTAFPASVQAADTWIVCFGTQPLHYAGQPECRTIAWHDMQLFFNSQPTLETVRLLDLSNGLSAAPLNITMFGNSFQADSFASLDSCLALGSCPATVFVAHLDVPHGVTVSSR